MARGYFGEEYLRFTKRVIINPSENLRGVESEALTHSLTVLTAVGFMRDIAKITDYREMYDDVYRHVFGCERLTVVEAGEQTLAYMAVNVLQTDIGVLYHLNGMIVDPSLHGNGFSRRILQEDIGAVNGNILAFHTQSVLMQGLGNRVSNFDHQLAVYVQGAIGTKNFVNDSGVIIDKGRYGRSLYGDVERFDQFAIKEPGFNFREGDAIIFAGRV